MKKVLAVFLALCMGILGACGQSQPQDPPLSTQPQALNIQLGAEPDTLDPTYAADAAEITYAAHLFEGLTTLNQQGEVLPGVAASWEMEENDEGLPVYTFHLDGSARWSDGVAVEAKDFVYAWERALTPTLSSPLAYHLYPIKGARAMKAGEEVENADPQEGEEAASPLQVEAVDESTLRVTLEGPCPYFLELCASSPVYFPLREDLVTQHPETWSNDPAALVSNGAYRLESWTHDGSIRMVKNPHYRNQAQIVQEELNFVLTADAQAVWTAFQEGQLQFADTLPLLNVQQAEEEEALVTRPLMSTYALVFNTATVADARVRQALSLAIDRTALTGQVLADGSIPAGAIIPQGVPGAAAGQDFRTEGGDYVSCDPSAVQTNLDRAKELLKEAGFEGGKNLPTLTYLTNDTEGNVKIAQAVQEMWAAVGVQVEIKALGWNEYVAAREAGEFDVARYSFSASGHTDPLALLDLWTSQSGQNLAGYQSERFDQLIAAVYSGEEIPEETPEGEEADDQDAAAPADSQEAAEGELTEEEQAALEQKAQEKARALRTGYLHEAESLLVSQDAIVAPLYYHADFMLISPQLQGVVISPLGTRWFGGAVLTQEDGETE